MLEVSVNDGWSQMTNRICSYVARCKEVYEIRKKNIIKKKILLHLLHPVVKVLITLNMKISGAGAERHSASKPGKKGIHPCEFATIHIEES